MPINLEKQMNFIIEIEGNDKTCYTFLKIFI